MTNEAKKELRAKRRVAGLCNDCGEDANGAFRCEKCNERNRKNIRAYFERRREAKKCIVPGCPNETDGKKVRCVQCALKYKQAYDNKVAAKLCTKCPEPAATGRLCTKHAKLQLEHNWDRKRKIMDHYNGPVCVGCGEDELTVLQLDHINGGGNKHRREVGGSKLAEGGKMYQWIIDNNYPPLFRVLCANCNRRAFVGVPFPNQRKAQDG